MCGLTGILAPKSGPEPERDATLARMTDRLAHRGPDDRGLWSVDRIALGHRRLSILDLSEAGAQPMPSACGRFMLAYNGEIYNHLDLRQALAQEGVSPDWRGHSDTETLLEAIAHWGLEATLTRASGMFALALWDAQSQRLSLARDRFGEKPMYWGWAGEDFVFASELKALCAHPNFAKDISPQALAQYLRFAYVPAPFSIYQNVFKLEPGTILQVDGRLDQSPRSTPLRPGETEGALSIKRYWDLGQTFENGQQRPYTQESQALGALKDALNGAINRQTLSDVPLGAFLSGGIDSSLIAALMQSQAARPIQTFTIGFDDPGYNEAPFAGEVAKHLGTDHTEIIVTDHDAQAVIARLPTLYDEPFADSSQIPTFLVAQAAKTKVTVALSGDAGDELFGGYNRYTWGPRLWAKLAPLPAPLRGAMAKLLLAVPPQKWDSVTAFVARSRGRDSLAQTGVKLHKLAHAMRDSRSLDDLYASLVSTWRAPLPLQNMPPSYAQIPLNDPLPKTFDGDAATRMMLRDMMSYLPGDILCKVDRAAMGVSLETRVPLLDPEVVNVAARLPLDMKIREGTGKWALREILYQHVPKSLMDRPKAGFSIPLGAWLRGPLRPWANALLTPKALARSPYLDAEAIGRCWEVHQSGARDLSAQLWTILMFQAWMETQA
ncbi:MAG: asparagine synthase (glutamine-hydrolyzing) [Maritimibacter sp.]